jgi:hypothetical protein
MRARHTVSAVIRQPLPLLLRAHALDFASMGRQKSDAAAAAVATAVPFLSQFDTYLRV